MGKNDAHLKRAEHKKMLCNTYNSLNLSQIIRTTYVSIYNTLPPPLLKNRELKYKN